MKLLTNLLKWSQVQGSVIAMRFINDSGDILQQLTYQELENKTNQLSSELLSKWNLTPGERVVLVYPPSLDFIVAFISCLKAGIIPVPVYPPDPTKLNKDLTMFSSLVKECGAKVALTNSSYNYVSKLSTIQSLFSKIEWPTLQWIVTDSTITNAETNFESQPQNNEANIAFLQFTSGSSSLPKGVIITRANLDHNLDIITQSLQASQSTVNISWLPQYHDMGLIGSYLGCIYCGGQGVYMSPITFIKNPILWVQTISQYKGTHSQAPDFAYTLTARKFLNRQKSSQKLLDIDLSALQHLINAAEPVQASSIDMFEAVFSSYGLPKGIIYPTYGLAEHTVFVSSNGKQRISVSKSALERDRKVILSNSNDDSVVLLGCGSPYAFDGMEVVLVDISFDEDGTDAKKSLLHENSVGEIWVSSPSKAHGYWNGDSIHTSNREEFTWTLENQSVDSNPKEYLRTGDLGFLHQGELFICGRVKDLIIIRGRNHYPQDLERTIERACRETRPGCTASFSISKSKQEEIVVVAELKEDELNGFDYESASNVIYEAIAREHGVQLSVLDFIKSRSIPKTTSGKVARRWVKKAYLEGTLNHIYVKHFNKSIDEDNAYHIHYQKRQSLLDDEHVDVSDDDVNKLNPLIMSVDEVIQIVLPAVETCCQHGDEVISLSADTPIASLGLDSMKIFELQETISRKFTIQLADEIIFNPDATIRSLSEALISGGVTTYRPYMIETWKMAEQAIKLWGHLPKEPAGALPEKWIHDNKILSHISTHQFPDNSALEETYFAKSHEIFFTIFAMLIFGIFVYIPVIGIYLFFIIPWQIYLTFLVIFLTIVYTLPMDTWPPFKRVYFLTVMACKYFSLRIVVDAPHDLATPSIYALEPHGIAPCAQPIQNHINAFLLGESFHLLVANAAFWMPVYNIILKLWSARPADSKTFLRTLESGESVGLIPGGIAEMFEVDNTPPHDEYEVLHIHNRKGFIKLALQTGAQIIPCYCFGNTQVFHTMKTDFQQWISRQLGIPLIWFWGVYGLPIPLRKPLLNVIGRPIVCPKITSPSSEAM